MATAAFPGHYRSVQPGPPMPQPNASVSAST